MENKGKITNKMSMNFLSIAENVAMARVAAASMAAQLELTIDDMEEIKVAISEAVTNAIIHGYHNSSDKWVYMEVTIYKDAMEITIEDKGCGISDIAQAMEPTYSSDPERMGLGFVFMKSFMDDLKVESAVDSGTKVIMVKKIYGVAHENALES